MKAQPVYEAFEPPVAIEIEHGVSGEKRHVVCEGWNHPTHQLDVRYPLSGLYHFSIATGEGFGDAKGWRITLASLRMLRKDPNYTPTHVIRRGAKRAVKPAETPPPDSRQKELF